MIHFRPRLRFSLRTLLVLVTIAAALCPLFKAYEAHRWQGVADICILPPDGTTITGEY